MLKPADRNRSGFNLRHEAKFLRSWLDRPLTTGAVSPSGRALARAMAAPVDPQGSGQVIELGPGTGPVTQALIERGVARERLVLVEYAADFVDLLRNRFPGVTVIQGDAYDVGRTLEGALSGPVAAVVSSLPLLTRPAAQRSRLVSDCFELSGADAPFVQFTYGATPPVPLHSGPFHATAGSRIWWNLPPARVWVYRRKG